MAECHKEDCRHGRPAEGMEREYSITIGYGAAMTTGYGKTVNEALRDGCRRAQLVQGNYSEVGNSFGALLGLLPAGQSEERALDETGQYTVPACRYCGLSFDECKCTEINF